MSLALGDAGTVRIEVADTRADRLPRAPERPEPDAESGRGLVLVEAFADRWGFRSVRGSVRRFGRKSIRSA